MIGVNVCAEKLANVIMNTDGLTMTGECLLRYGDHEDNGIKQQ